MRKGVVDIEATVYGDLLFMINFSMDFICLYISAKLLSRPMSVPRYLLASALGGVYSVAILFVNISNVAITNILVDLVVCLAICTIAVLRRSDSFFSLVIFSAAYVVISMLLGGVMTGIFSLLNRAAPSFDSFGDTTALPLPMLISVAALSVALTYAGGHFLKKRSEVESVTLEVSFKDRKIDLSAMCDSGNLLRDPIFGKAVIVADKSVARRLAPELTKNGELIHNHDTTILAPELAGRIRLIPTSTTSSEGLLLAIRPDKILVKDSKDTHEADALIAFAEIKSALCGCNALIPPELLT